MRQTIRVWIENKHGALNRIVGIISGKGANIRSLSMTPDPQRKGASRITVVADVEPCFREKVIQEIGRLVNVFAAVDVSANPQETPWPLTRSEAARLAPAGMQMYAS
jgi:acetolactate synthase small subunit